METFKNPMQGLKEFEDLEQVLQKMQTGKKGIL